MKNETIFFGKWPSTGCLDTHLAKRLVWICTLFVGTVLWSWVRQCTLAVSLSLYRRIKGCWGPIRETCQNLGEGTCNRLACIPPCVSSANLCPDAVKH